jgi:hypothetical protein
MLFMLGLFIGMLPLGRVMGLTIAFKLVAASVLIVHAADFGNTM